MGAVRSWIVVLVGLGLIGSIASMALAFAISDFIESRKFGSNTVWLLTLGAALKIVVAMFQEWFSAKVSTKTKQQLRSELLSVNFANGTVSSAEVTILATKGLDALDAYFSKFLPQFIYALLVTPITVAVFFFVDPLSSLILAVTIPLIPLFMVFIGKATKSEQERQYESLLNLGRHFTEVVRGLSTLKLFGRIQHQLSVLNEISERIRIRTMRVLRISFLSGFALELAASLSVALLAVTIGFRLLDDQIAFATAMFLLILAPDAYLPIRTIGANYHASTEGITAAARILDILGSSDLEPDQNVELPSQGLEIWVGPSGSGKTRRLEQLVFGEHLDRVAWMPQESVLLSGTVQSNIVGDQLDPAILEWSVNFAGLDDVQLNQEIDDYGRGLSGGQSQRVSLARALYRLRVKKLNVLLLDEPTSSIDPERATQIWTRLRALAREQVAIRIVTHQTEFIELCDEVIHV